MCQIHPERLRFGAIALDHLSSVQKKDDISVNSVVQDPSCQVQPTHTAAPCMGAHWEGKGESQSAGSWWGLQ